MRSLIEKYRSPNYNDRASGVDPSMILLHATQMSNLNEALTRLCDRDSHVSAHYLIDKLGVVYKLVDEKYRAWHAGEACWREKTDINSESIGVELDNDWEIYNYEQLQALVDLLKFLCARYNIKKENIWGHSDVAPHRKEDPGAHFPWKWLADQGFGLVIPCKSDDYSELSEKEARQVLSYIGYNSNGLNSYQLRDILFAFQQHFMPDNCTAQLDSRTKAILSFFKGKN